jgi:hypothetical protein
LSNDRYVAPDFRKMRQIPQKLQRFLSAADELGPAADFDASDDCGSSEKDEC